MRKAAKALVENGGNKGAALRTAGYSNAVIKNPKKVTDSPTFQDLFNSMLPDDLLAEKHLELLNASRVDHMIFPLGPGDEPDEADEDGDGIEEELEEQGHGGALLRKMFQPEHTKLTDEDITELLASVNCTVRKIVRGRTARHVYFWSADNKARKDALDMAYKIKASYAPEKREIKGTLSLSDLLDAADGNLPIEQDDE